MKRFYILALAATTLAMAATAREYKPLLEQGKEWHYTSVCWFPNDNPTENVEVLKIEGTTIIDDEEYHILNLYYGPDHDNLEFLEPMAYLKEDTETRKVRAILNLDGLYNPLQSVIEYFGNDIVYDFTYTDNTYVVNPDFGYTYGQETQMMCEDGVHSGITIMGRDAESPYSIIEGIGLVGKGRKGSCYLLYYGESFVASYYSYQWPFLYKVVGGNGELIYCDESFAPGFAGAIAAKADSDATATVFNLQGMKVRECDAAANPADGLTPGVYLIRTGCVTRKIHVVNR